VRLKHITMNSDSTIGSFKSILLPFLNQTCTLNNEILMDSATCHISDDTYSWIKSTNMKFIPSAGHPRNIENGYPPNSPDMNPIELCWGIVESKVEKEDYSTVKEFINVVQKAWDELDLKTIQNCINRQKKVNKYVIFNCGEFYKE